MKISGVKVLARPGLQAESDSMRGVAGADGKQGPRGPPGARGPPGKCCDYTGDSPPIRVIKNGGSRKLFEDDTVVILSSKESISLTPPVMKNFVVDNEDSYVHVKVITILTSESVTTHYLNLNEIYPLKPNRKYTVYFFEDRWVLCAN